MSNQSDKATSQSRPPVGHGRWILRGGLLVVAIVSACVLINANKPTRTAAEVISHVQATALRKPSGGSIGDWWVSAQTLDPVGRLVNFHIDAGPVQFAAQSCTIVIDPKQDSITLEMTGVVLIRVDELSFGEAENRPLVEMERYTLGPIPYPINIR